MRITRALGVALGLTLLGSTAAQADDPFRLTGAGSTVSGGVYVGPYRGVLGSDPTSPTIDVVCVDYLNHAQIDVQTQVRTTNLGDGWNATAVRFGSVFGTPEQAQLAYRQAAWLSWQFASTPPSSQAWGDIHRSIWHIFSPAQAPDPSVAAWNSLQTAWNDWYNGAGRNYDWNSVVVLTDARTVPDPRGGLRPGVNGQQEFITTTPEPATLLLLGSGLVFVLGLTLKRGGMFA